MRPIDRSEILGLGEYEGIREQFRRRVVEEKRARRVHLGDIYTVVFENRDTVLLQIQEMLRTERITQESAIRHEIETYNELVPGDAQVSITLFVEIVDKAERDRRLVELAGLEDAIVIEVDGRAYPFHGKREGAEPGRTTAVHYLKADLPVEALAAMRARTSRVALAVTHPAGAARLELPPPVLQKLADDLV